MQDKKRRLSRPEKIAVIFALLAGICESTALAIGGLPAFILLLAPGASFRSFRSVPAFWLFSSAVGLSTAVQEVDW